MIPDTELAQYPVEAALSPTISRRMLKDVRAFALFVPCALAFMLFGGTLLIVALVASAVLAPAVVLVAGWAMARHDRRAAPAGSTSACT